MPSATHLQEKQAVVSEIKAKLDRASAAVVIDYIGINVAQADAMRKKLREAGVDYKVYKNTLMKRAIEGTPFASLGESLSGPSAFAFGFEDAVAPARALDGIMKDFKKMEFKAGVIEGSLYDAEGLKQIASLPTKDELIARFMGSIQSPVGKLVRTFKAVADAMEDGSLGSGKPAEAAPAADAEEAKPDAAPVAEAEAAPAEEPAAEDKTDAAEAEAAPAEAPATDDKAEAVDAAAKSDEQAE
ncbi:MAG: 50S ribosomal protein L10 [Clostridiales Family XIII bacterium]|jgi:large subunit ribosomal protein L10|nr:50S ribosomal protein L10 [Clostridiales Family XIII bacterium]